MGRRRQRLPKDKKIRSVIRSMKQGKSVFLKTNLISGPPGAGKTTYVKSNIKKGELVFDVDAIYQALTFQPAYVKPKSIDNFVYRIRDKVFQLLKEPNHLSKAWIITSYADPTKRKELIDSLSAKSKLLIPESQVCKQRIKEQDRKGDYDWDKIIDQWFEEFAAMDAEEYIDPYGGGGNH